jgi:3',5'-cyclic AMP phosphodiesterase CpdA
MPGYFDRTISRRGFVQATAGAAAALAMRGSSLRAAETPAAFRMALLSDTHIPADPEGQYRGFFPVRNLESVLPGVLKAQPEVALICGDAARLTGEAGDYEALKRLLAPLAEQVPIHIGLGNHDDRANFFSVFDQVPPGRQEVAGKHVSVIERSAVRGIVLDSLLYVDRVAGLLGKAQRQWLTDYLASVDNRPTVLFVHHTLGDGDGDLLDADRMFERLRPHPKVQAIFFGHSHVWGITERAGVHLVNLPAVGYNFRDQDPVGWVEAEFTSAGVDLTLHATAGNQAEDGKRQFLSWRQA